MAGNIASLHFPSPRFSQYVDGARVNKVGALTGTFAELHFTDIRFGDTLFSDIPLVEQIVRDMNTQLNKANVRVLSAVKGAITGKAYTLQFQRLAAGIAPEPSYTWRVQLMTAMIPKLSQYGYEFTNETRTERQSTFYFVEKKGVLNELLGV